MNQPPDPAHPQQPLANPQPQPAYSQQKPAYSQQKPAGEFSTTHLFRRYADSHDPDALADLVKRVGPRLYAQASQQIATYLQARFGAEDIEQSVWVSFVKKVDEGKFVWQDSQQFHALLCDMIRTKVYEYVRRHKAQKRAATKDQPLHGPAGLQFDPPVSRDEVDSFLGEEVEHWTRRLAEHFQDKPTHLRVLPGIIDKKTPKEIADALGITVTYVRLIIRDAEKFVRESLSER